ncbi:MAG: lipopolysaccharide heptosyltransferase II [Candidatus Tenebribacter davisii]|jgi:heptosyltransferase-2|nr:lipopolysaccharide heptosyltransferase II [Candidatus Tenebribacter davisii]
MKILFIRLSSLGDIVLTQSAVQAVHSKYPDAKIHYLTKSVFAPIVEMFNCVDEIHYWEKKYSLLKDIRKIKFDVAIDLHAKFNTFIIKSFINAKRNITYNKKHLLRRQIVNRKTDKVISSTVSLYFNALKKIGIDSKIAEPKLFTTKSIKMPEKFQISKHVKNIGLFPGALHKTKQYPIEQLAEFINSVPDAWNCRFIIFGSEAELDLADKLDSLTKSIILDLCGKLTLQQLVTAIDKMDVLITNDSGPMHIAAALKKPQIAIFGATHPKLGFAPMNRKAIVLSADLSCQPCTLHGGEKCPKKHFKCMRSISSEQIINSLNSIIAENTL